MSEFDLADSFELPPTPSTRDFIALCIVILTVLFFIFFVTICKWSRCPCLKRYFSNRDETNVGSLAMQSDMSRSNSFVQTRPGQTHGLSSHEDFEDTHRFVCSTRDGLLSPPPMPYELFVWITDAASDIGRELLKELVRLSPSTRFVVSAEYDNELYSLVTELKLNSDRYLILPFNLENREYGFESKVDIILNRFRRIDVLINNSGASQRSLIKNTTHRTDVALFNNFLGIITLTKAVLTHFIEEHRKGHIVVVASITSYATLPLHSTHSATNHGLRGYFDCLRLEHTKDNIDVTIAYPDFIRKNMSTDPLKHLDQSHIKIDQETEQGIDPALCAYEILCGVASRKHEIYIGSIAYVFVYLRRFCPQLLNRILFRMNPA